MTNNPAPSTYKIAPTSIMKLRGFDMALYGVLRKSDDMIVEVYPTLGEAGEAVRELNSLARQSGGWR